MQLGMTESDKFCNSTLIPKVKNEEISYFSQNEYPMSPINCDLENVDIENINFDDILEDDWNGNNKNTQSKNKITGDSESLSLCTLNSVVPDYVPAATNTGNKIFLITDILNQNGQIYFPGAKSDVKLSESAHEQQSQQVEPVNRLKLIGGDAGFLLNLHSNMLLSSMSAAAVAAATTGTEVAPVNLSRSKSLAPCKKRAAGFAKVAKSQLCLVCNDSATGKHYGVLSCEGCKGFFKRTVRNSLAYTCRDFSNCSVDKKFRNRCQACRFQKCVQTGMKREAVQIEKADKPEPEMLQPETMDTSQQSVEAVSQCDEDEEKPVEVDDALSQLMEHGHMLQVDLDHNPDIEVHGVCRHIYVMDVICKVVNEHLFNIVSWAKYVPGFDRLSLHDQTLLIKMGWGELVICNFVHRSMKLNADEILLIDGSKLQRDNAYKGGVGKLIDRIIFDVLHRFRDLHIDRCELSYLKAIILFNPTLRDLEDPGTVSQIRARYYAALSSYCLQQSGVSPGDPLRYNKILLRLLPPLRSIAHSCIEHFRVHDIGDAELRLQRQMDDVATAHRCITTPEGGSDQGNAETPSCASASVSSSGENVGTTEASVAVESQLCFLSEMLGHSDIITDH